MKIDLENIKNVKNGTVTINRIMQGDNKIWPKFPFVLLRDKVYYNVTGIVNNEYVSTVIPTQISVECPLVNCKSCYNTNLYRQNRLQFEMAFTSVDVHGRTFFGNNRNDTVRSARWFTASTTTWYLDYMASSSSASSVRRINTSVSSPYDMYNQQRVKKFVYRAGYDKLTNRNFINLKNYDSSTYDILQYSPEQTPYNAPEPSLIENELLRLGCWNTQDHLLMYYGKLMDEDDNIIGFWYFKNVDGQYKMYDELSGQYLQAMSGYPGESNNVVYADNTITENIDAYSGEPPYIVDGVIVDGSDTYEKLVNTESGHVMKGIKL